MLSTSFRSCPKWPGNLLKMHRDGEKIAASLFDPATRMPMEMGVSCASVVESSVKSEMDELVSS